MAAPLPESARSVVDGTNFGVVTTLEPDGSPQSSVVWVALDGEDIVFSTVRGRRKERNLAGDPRISLLVYPLDQPYSYLEVRGVAEMSEEGGRQLIDRLAGKYFGVPRYDGDGPGDVRVVVRVKADKVVWHG
jgi:PPOX class probable F420-dependent enzyme